MGLELVAVSLGLCTFIDMLRGKKVVVHCDNKGAEVVCVLFVLRAALPLSARPRLERFLLVVLIMRS